jgi:hypothetical protein
MTKARMTNQLRKLRSHTPPRALRLARKASSTPPPDAAQSHTLQHSEYDFGRTSQPMQHNPTNCSISKMNCRRTAAAGYAGCRNPRTQVSPTTSRKFQIRNPPPAAPCKKTQELARFFQARFRSAASPPAGRRNEAQRFHASLRALGVLAVCNPHSELRTRKPSSPPAPG